VLGGHRKETAGGRQLPVNRGCFGDLIKWSFVFWVGAVGAIAMLARALR